MMLENPSAIATEDERAELERIISALSRWPRLSDLLRYMGDRLLSGELDQINEYNIATEVLGRSKSTFDSTDDAIARVETHRLRKRLAEFYKGEGSDHPIQVTIPAGSYVPVFVHKPAGGPATLPSLAPPSVSEPKQENAHSPARAFARWRYAALAACVVAATVGVFIYLHLRDSREGKINSAPSSAAALTSGAPLAGSGAVRLLAGYSGPPRTDSAGRVWSSDQYFQAGGTWQRDIASITGTSDPFLFEHSRTGDFSYSIPLQPGVYELHLFFSSLTSDVFASFSVTLNGAPLLNAFDVNIDALGHDIADERVFRDVSPGKDGYLHIAFDHIMAPSTLNAIEILPGTPHAQLPVRLVMQSSPVTDDKGQFWHPDDYFMNGQLAKSSHLLLNSSDPDLFSGERIGHFTYAIPVDTRDSYTLVLHFAEFYFSSATSSSSGRLFKVMCNGQTLLDNFDIFKEAGYLHELTKTFHHLKPSHQGKLNLTFEPIMNNATISGIEVIDESR